jgi:hypothetical protein
MWPILDGNRRNGVSHYGATKTAGNCFMPRREERPPQSSSFLIIGEHPPP